MNTNSENPKVGKQFQLAVTKWFNNNMQCSYEIEKKMAIGNPPKLHSFDLASTDSKMVYECKCYTWTASGNVPSAKMGFTNEAAFYLSFLPERVEKAIIMLKSTHVKRSETLAEYYYRTNRHLLGDIKVMEYDILTDSMRTIGKY